jgi:hypothetical protein
MKRYILFLTILGTTLCAWGYPIDGYDRTLIHRLQPAWETHFGGNGKPSLPQGALLDTEAIVPSGHGVINLPENDPQLAAKLKQMLGNEADLYSVAIIDLSTPDNPRFIAHREDHIANVGRVGKLLVMYALFDQLARLYPDDISAREKILRDTMITANDWVLSDHHTVQIYDPAVGHMVRRQMRVGDTGNLWEYMDWMLSASNNSAATIVLQQVILMEKFGHDYPLATAESEAFLSKASAKELGELWLAAMYRPLVKAGFDTNRFRQGSPFTGTARKRIQGTSSVGTARDLAMLYNLIEAKRLVDEWSSVEAKRLLYSTERRIRYASHPVLNDAAVFFKSGSYFKCKPEPDFVCRQYMGNEINRLASTILIESPAGSPRLRYIVAVMSNVLRVNSAVAHQTLALRIHRFIESLHANDVTDEPESSELSPARIESLAEQS